MCCKIHIVKYTFKMADRKCYRLFPFETINEWIKNFNNYFAGKPPPPPRTESPCRYTAHSTPRRLHLAVIMCTADCMIAFTSSKRFNKQIFSVLCNFHLVYRFYRQRRTFSPENLSHYTNTTRVTQSPVHPKENYYFFVDLMAT